MSESDAWADRLNKLRIKCQEQSEKLAVHLDVKRFKVRDDSTPTGKGKGTVMLRDLAEALRQRSTPKFDGSTATIRPSSACSVASTAVSESRERRPSSSFFRSFPSVIEGVERVAVLDRSAKDTDVSSSRATSSCREDDLKDDQFQAWSDELEDLAQCSAANSFETVLCHRQIQDHYRQLPSGVCFCFRCGQGPFVRERSETSCTACGTILHFGCDDYSDTVVLSRFKEHATRRRLIIAEEKWQLLKKINAVLKRLGREPRQNVQDANAATPRPTELQRTREMAHHPPPKTASTPSKPLTSISALKPASNVNPLRPPRVAQPRAPSQRATALRARLSALENEPNPLFRLGNVEDESASPAGLAAGLSLPAVVNRRFQGAPAIVKGKSLSSK